jgi:hypothetical protein
MVEAGGYAFVPAQLLCLLCRDIELYQLSLAPYLSTFAYRDGADFGRMQKRGGCNADIWRPTSDAGLLS